MNAADSSNMQARTDALRAANRRTGLALMSVAGVFFLGIVMKYWLLG